MKKKSIINLIKYYSEKNDAGLEMMAYQIAKDLMKLVIINYQNTLWH